MLRINVNTAEAVVTETELITAGRRGLKCAFSFSSDWDGLSKVAVFQGVVTRDVALLTSNEITVPAECIAKAQFPLKIGVYGANGDGTIAIPTIWCSFGKVLPSATRSNIPPDELTPDIVAQIQSAAANALWIAQQIQTQADSGAFDGFSPTISVERIQGGWTVLITNENGSLAIPVMDGAKGDKGDPGSSVWWAAASARVVDAFVRINQLSGRPDVLPQLGDMVFFDDYEVYRITVVGQELVSISRIGSIVGPKGDPFEYEDFTPAQLEALTGPPGEPGNDGVSPDVSVTTITGGHRVAITDAQGTNTFDVMDGAKGDPGVGIQEVFWAEYSTTTEAEITAAVTAGKTVLCKIGDEVFYLTQKAAVGPSGSAWIFACVGQSSIRVTFVSGSYWNTISTATIPSKTSDLNNDSGFVNASGAAAAAPVQSVNGQTGAVTVPSLPSGGTVGQVLTLVSALPSGTTPSWADVPSDAVFEFELDANWEVDSGPLWSDIDSAVFDEKSVIAKVTTPDGDTLFLPLVKYADGTGGTTYAIKFSVIGEDTIIRSVEAAIGVVNTWTYTEYDIEDNYNWLANNKLENNMGAANAGKFLVVGSDGAVTTMTLATWQAGSY